MPVFTGGGSAVGSAEINDGAIVNADVNAAAAIAQSKIAGIAGAAGDLIDVVYETDSSVDVVLDGKTKIVVIAKGNYVDIGNETQTATLRQDTVVKDTTQVNLGSTADQEGFCLMYSETPAADTYTIDVITSDPSGVANVKIMVFKIKTV